MAWLFRAIMTGFDTIPPDRTSRHLMGPIGGLFFFLEVLLLIYAIVALVSGLGLLRYKRWAKYGTFVVAVLAVFNFPLGTLYGVGSIYVLTRPEVDQLLK